MLVTLGEQKVLTLTDLADLASDELTGAFDVIKGDRVKIKGYLEDFALSKKEADVLLLQWKDTFSTLVNSNVDRLSKDSFKIWFLSLASYSIPELEKDANELWSKLLEGVEYCHKFSIKDVPYPLNTISKN